MPSRVPRLWATLAAAALTVAVAGLAAAPRPAGAVNAAGQRERATGYWMVASDGGVFSFGSARFHGSTGAIALKQPIVGMAPTPSGNGYWLVASDGGIFAFGDAAFFGSTGAIRLNRPIVGMAPTPSGNGYWLVASDGGIFAFGGARFHGSTGAIALAQPIVGMATTPSGNGYWLVASDGGIFAFGDAAFFGSTGAIRLNRPIVAMTPTASGRGYWLVASDGGIFAFGDARFWGSTGALTLAQPVVGMGGTGLGHGYWLVASDGGVFSFGDAPFFGSTGAIPLNRPIVGIAPRLRPHLSQVSIFTYPWYANPEHDGVWRHWEQAGHAPPDDIGASFYPARGAYSSADPAIQAAQMAEIKAAGVDTIVTSWWGANSFEDQHLPTVVAAARAHGLRVAIHLEPYVGRTVASSENDIRRLHATFGIDEFWLYLADSTGTATAWRAAVNRLPAGLTLWAESGNLTRTKSGELAAFAAAAGLDGIYTYDPVRYRTVDFVDVCAGAHARHLLCSPSVAPGYDATRAGPDRRIVGREDGRTYDRNWQGALDAGADVVSITSYNEWHEGTQIEPAVPKCLPLQGYCYSNYLGAYGRTADAPTAYLDRTRFWADRAHAGR